MGVRQVSWGPFWFENDVGPINTKCFYFLQSHLVTHDRDL